MKKYSYFFLSFICFWAVEIHAQQDAQFIGFRQNGLAYNPAYAGSRDVNSLMAYYRAQWINIDNTTPRTFSLSWHAPMGFTNNPQFKNVGLGVWLLNDRVNIHNRTHINTSYSYKLEDLGPGTLALGLQLGLMNINSKYSELENSNTTDALLISDVNRWLGNFGAGAYYYTDEYFVGASIPHLIQNKLIDADQDAVWSRHYYLTAGGVIEINQDFKLKPAVLFKKVKNAPASVDLSASVIFENRLSVGAALRWKESIDLYADYQLNQNLLIGYGFDFTTTKLASFGSSHDIYLRYEFGFMNERVVTPRFF